MLQRRPARYLTAGSALPSSLLRTLRAAVRSDEATATPSRAEERWEDQLKQAGVRFDPSDGEEAGILHPSNGEVADCFQAK
jgi:hypothetical protein